MRAASRAHRHLCARQLGHHLRHVTHASSLGDLAHAPLVADAPQFRKGARVVARVGYNAVRAGDRGVVVGPCNVLTMPNASKRVLVDFGTGKGLYNYAAGTQLDVAADDAPGVFPSLNGA